jgi:hypothetical protein
MTHHDSAFLDDIDLAIYNNIMRFFLLSETLRKRGRLSFGSRTNIDMWQKEKDGSLAIKDLSCGNMIVPRFNARSKSKERQVPMMEISCIGVND